MRDTFRRTKNNVETLPPPPPLPPSTFPLCRPSAAAGHGGMVVYPGPRLLVHVPLLGYRLELTREIGVMCASTVPTKLYPICRSVDRKRSRCRRKVGDLFASSSVKAFRSASKYSRLRRQSVGVEVAQQTGL